MNAAAREGVPRLAGEVSSTANDAEIERRSGHCDGAHRARAGTRNASRRPIDPRGTAPSGLERVKSRFERLVAICSFGLECAWQGMKERVKSGKNSNRPLICNIRARDVRRVSA